MRVAVHRLTYAFSNHVKSAHVKAGFIDSGVFSISFRSIMNQLFGNDFKSLGMFNLLETKAIEAVPTFQTEGVLEEEATTHMGIPESPPDHNSLPRDTRALWN